MEDKKPSIVRLFSDIARLARTGDYPTAALSFNRGILLLQERMGAADVQGPSQLDRKQITESLRTLLLLLEHNDWVAIADVIDYEFIPLWKKSFPSA